MRTDLQIFVKVELIAASDLFVVNDRSNTCTMNSHISHVSLFCNCKSKFLLLKHVTCTWNSLIDYVLLFVTVKVNCLLMTYFTCYFSPMQKKFHMSRCFETVSQHIALQSPLTK